MTFSPEIVIIASAQDGVATRLRLALEQKGRRVSQLDGPAAARLFTIHVRDGKGTVTPNIPLFVRSSAWWRERPSDDPDENFLRAEAYATFWAATALSAAPVINRPGPNGLLGRLTSGALGDGSPTFPDAARETHASGPETIDDVEGWWGEDLDFNSGPVSQLRRNIPMRARRVNMDALYEIVTVVGDRAFAATLDPRTKEHRLAERSLAIAKQVNVHFATITWAIDTRGAVPARLNAAPEDTDLRFAWPEIADALCEDLKA